MRTTSARYCTCNRCDSAAACDGRVMPRDGRSQRSVANVSRTPRTPPHRRARPPCCRAAVPGLRGRLDRALRPGRRRQRGGPAVTCPAQGVASPRRRSRLRGGSLRPRALGHRHGAGKRRAGTRRARAWAWARAAGMSRACVRPAPAAAHRCHTAPFSSMTHRSPTQLDRTTAVSRRGNSEAEAARAEDVSGGLRSGTGCAPTTHAPQPVAKRLSSPMTIGSDRLRRQRARGARARRVVQRASNAERRPASSRVTY